MNTSVTFWNIGETVERSNRREVPVISDSSAGSSFFLSHFQRTHGPQKKYTSQMNKRNDIK